MRTMAFHWGVLVLAVVVFGPAALAGAEGVRSNKDRLTGAASGARVQVRVERSGDAEPQIRIWINGEEVGPDGGPARIGVRRLAPGSPPDAEGEPEGFLGIRAARLPEEMKPIAGVDEGVLINSLTDDSPAAKAGLLAGDVITTIDGQKVATPRELVERIRRHKPGDRVRVTYYRMGDPGKATATLGRRPPERQLTLERRFPLYAVPERWMEEMPELREYLERLRADLEERAKKWRERRPGRESEEPDPKRLRPRVTPLPVPGVEPYNVGKDIGRILERLRRIEKRLGRIEERLERLEE